jgi:ABC-type amino acid transport substrate-binding protein
MVVKDHRRGDFSDLASVQAMPQLRVAIPATSYYMKHAASFLPQAELVPLQSARTFFRDEAGDADALIFSAEAGSAWTLVYPAFSVTVLHPSKIRIPLVAAVRRGDRGFVETVNRWFELREADGTIDRAYERWILGHDDAPRAPRWSVIRDVLGWVD